MKYVVLSDLHGNAPALQKVIDVEGSDKAYIVLGDLMGLNSYPQETVALLEQIEPRVLLAGNHDKAIFHEGEGHVNDSALSSFELHHTISNLSEEDKEWIESLPFMEVWQDGDQRICATHAFPWPAEASGYEAGNAGIRKRDVMTVASVVGDDYDWVFHGHTHEQYDIDASKWGHGVHFVNPGSLGYQQTYSIVDTEAGTVEHKSVEPSDDQVKAHLKQVVPDDAPRVEKWY